MKKNKGFTLIELLAVIVILAVIALIATPLIMETITKAKVNSFKDSMYGILKSAETYAGEVLLESKNDFNGESIQLPETGDKKLNYKGQEIEKGEVVIDPFGSLSIEAENGLGCFYKNAKENDIKKYDGSCDELENYQGYWKVPTDEKYFKVAIGDNDIARIINYDIKGGTDVVIPHKIQGKVVTVIGRNNTNYSDIPFQSKGLTSVFIPDTVVLIDSSAFANNHLKSVILPYDLEGIWGGAFLKNELEYVEFRGRKPSSVSSSVFKDNPNLLKSHTIKVPDGTLKSYKNVVSVYGDDARISWFGEDAPSNALDAFYE